MFLVFHLSHFLPNLSLSSVRLKKPRWLNQMPYNLPLRSLQAAAQTPPSQWQERDLLTSFPDSADHRQGQTQMKQEGLHLDRHPIIEFVLRCCSSPCLLLCHRQIGRITCWKKRRKKRKTNSPTWCLEWQELTIDNRRVLHYNQNINVLNSSVLLSSSLYYCC